MKSIIIFVLSILILSHQPSYSNSENFAQLNSELSGWLEYIPLKDVPSQPDLPYPARWMYWVPTGAAGSVYKPKCRSEELSKLLEEQGNENKQAEILNAFLANCSDHRNRSNLSKPLAALKFSAARYDIVKNRQVRAVSFNLKHGIKANAWFGLSRKRAPRPLVIVQCGILCDYYDSISRILMMKLFDSTDFHVIVLGSTSGQDFVQMNKRVAVGGYYEARQILEIAEVLSKKSTFSHRVSSVHVVGISLGGQAAVYSSLFNSSNFSSSKEKMISSAFAWCPVVNLKDSMENVFIGRGKFYGKNFFFPAIKYYSKIVEFPAPIPPIDFDKYPMEKVPGLIGSWATEHYSVISKNSNWLPAPLSSYKIVSSDDFWELSDFTKYIRYVDIPLMFFASNDDPIVVTEQNSKTVETANRDIQNPNISAHFIRNGHHCASGQFYGWDFMISMMTSRIRALDSRFKTFNVSKNLQLKIDRPFKLYGEEEIVNYAWLTKENKSSVLLKLRIFKKSVIKDSVKCQSWSADKAPSFCFRDDQREVSLRNLGINYMAGNKVEAQALTRYLNANIRLIDESGKTIVYKRPKNIVVNWTEY